jgi:hypothetical protein
MLNSRPTLTYGLWGFEARQQIVIKTLMRLMSDKLPQQWRYVLADDSQTEPLHALRGIDLAVVAADQWDALGKLTPQQLQSILLIGSRQDYPSPHLTLPLIPADLESMLIRLGKLLTLRPTAYADEPIVRFRTAANYSSPATSPTPTSAVPSVQFNSSQRYRLKRWPPVSLLSTPSAVKLATLLTGRELNAEELQRMSGQELSACRHFLAHLQQAQLLQTAATTAPPPTPALAAAKPAQSLLSMIRSRLGI